MQWILPSLIRGMARASYGCLSRKWPRYIESALCHTILLMPSEAANDITIAVIMMGQSTYNFHNYSYPLAAKTLLTLRLLPDCLSATRATPHERHDVISSASWLFIQQFVQIKNKQNIKSPYFLPFVLLALYEGSLVDSPHKGQVLRKAFPCHDGHHRRLLMWETESINDK